jgi:queuine/archaeosine tRNA-ribosyltransferase
VEKVIRDLLEMSKIRDEVAINLNQVALRLNSLTLAIRENIDEDKLDDFVDQFSSRIY